MSPQHGPPSLDHCPGCGRWISDNDDTGMEAETGQRWCIVHAMATGWYAVTGLRNVYANHAVGGTVPLAHGADLRTHLRAETVPVFFLNANVQGITDVEHARRLAAQIIGPDVDVNSIVAEEITS